MRLKDIRLLDISRINLNFGTYEWNDRKDKMFTVRLKLDKSFWGEAVLTIIYLRNRCRNRSDKSFSSMMPQETCSGKRLDVSHLKVFSRAYSKGITNEARFEIEASC